MRIILLISTVILLGACAKTDGGSSVKAAGACAANPALGNWVVSGQEIDLRDDCTGTLYAACTAEFKYTDLGNNNVQLQYTTIQNQQACTLSPGQVMNVKAYLYPSEPRLQIGWPAANNPSSFTMINYLPK